MKLTKSKGGSAFRKIAMGSWRTAADPSVYGLLEIDMTKALAYMENKESQMGVRLSLSHLVGKAVAMAMQERPEINGMIRLNRIYLRKHVDLFYQVNVPGGENDPVGKANLTGVTIRKAETLSVIEIAEALNAKAKSIKHGEDSELTKSVQVLRWVPWMLIRTILNVTSFLNYDLGINLTWAGMPRDAFGSVMITNIGSLGGDTAWAPLVPYTKVPMLLTVGSPRPRPWVTESGQIEARQICRIGVTFDHRFMDGSHAAAMSKTFEKCFAHPEKYFG
ncbi:2-oxo acid dehydrogenase subunit E2 [Bdellovibrio sp. HCB337]|uniref:2-oxo acid dehydrogenase subunit E2 n=1 Tax=Bdellovibrio sp. HCB337 TaxID=3394358 RepID=UPI0039A76278